MIINKLTPTIIQDEKGGEVYMLGYMTNQSLNQTRKTGWVTFWSRSRQKLWVKGETSGNKLKVKNIFSDCDNDALLIKVQLFGKVCCHTGKRTCFFKKL